MSATIIKPWNLPRPMTPASQEPTPKTNGALQTGTEARPVHVTFFKNSSAYSLEEKSVALCDLRDLILTTNADMKDNLPWLKLAKFGDKRTNKGSLRHDENILAISGVELDYDNKEISFEKAVHTVKDARLHALTYTSPSHTDEQPKWRVLLPTSHDLPPSERNKQVARVNGLFGGVFAGESFTLSQSYFFGSVNNNPAHRAEIVEGNYLDLRSDLDASAIYRKQRRIKKADASINQTKGVEAYLARLGDGDGLDGFNRPLCSASAAYAVRHGANLDRGILKAKLREAIMRAPKTSDRNNVETHYLTDAYLDKLIESAVEKFGAGVSFEDFRAYMPLHTYIYVPAGDPWPATSVNARLGSVPLLDAGGNQVLNKKDEPVEIPASTWLDQNQPVEQMTWAPGFPTLIENRLVNDGGWFPRPAVTCFNLYRPPIIKLGNPAKAQRWLDHVYKVFNENDARHIVQWCAHRRQRPQEKINHALVTGSNDQGIGKDTALEPLKYAVGPWNFQEVSPPQLIGRFNGFLKSVVLRVNEARDLGDINRYQFYDHMKAYTAAPPDVLRVDEKNLREHNIFNVCGVIISTNHKADGIFLPPDDRRHYVAWSERVRADFPEGYWAGLWRWYETEGFQHVAGYLQELDISAFDPKAPPAKTEAFWAIVNANRAPEDSELADALDKLGNPAAITLASIAREAHGDFLEWLSDRKNRRVFSHRFEACGYVPVRNSDAKDGLWKIDGARQVVYARAELPVSGQIEAARALNGSAAAQVSKVAEGKPWSVK